jgi:hypothetical protein
MVLLLMALDLVARVFLGWHPSYLAPGAGGWIVEAGDREPPGNCTAGLDPESLAGYDLFVDFNRSRAWLAPGMWRDLVFSAEVLLRRTAGDPLRHLQVLFAVSALQRVESEELPARNYPATPWPPLDPEGCPGCGLEPKEFGVRVYPVFYVEPPFYYPLLSEDIMLVDHRGYLYWFRSFQVGDRRVLLRGTAPIITAPPSFNITRLGLAYSGAGDRVWVGVVDVDEFRAYEIGSRVVLARRYTSGNQTIEEYNVYKLYSVRFRAWFGVSNGSHTAWQEGRLFNFTASAASAGTKRFTGGAFASVQPMAMLDVAWKPYLAAVYNVTEGNVTRVYRVYRAAFEREVFWRGVAVEIPRFTVFITVAPVSGIRPNLIARLHPGPYEGGFIHRLPPNITLLLPVTTLEFNKTWTLKALVKPSDLGLPDGAGGWVTGGDARAMLKAFDKVDTGLFRFERWGALAAVDLNWNLRLPIDPPWGEVTRVRPEWNLTVAWLLKVNLAEYKLLARNETLLQRLRGLQLSLLDYSIASSIKTCLLKHLREYYASIHPNVRNVAEKYNLTVYWVMAGSIPSYMEYCELPRLEGVSRTTLALALGCGDPDTINELAYQLLHGVVGNLWKFNTTYTGLLPDSRAPRRTVAVAGALNAVPEAWEMEVFNLTERQACGYVVAFTWHEKSVFTRFDNLEVKPTCPGTRQEEGTPFPDIPPMPV